MGLPTSVDPSLLGQLGYIFRNKSILKTSALVSKSGILIFIILFPSPKKQLHPAHLLVGSHRRGWSSQQWAG